jgi:hypothetical protein
LHVDKLREACGFSPMPRKEIVEKTVYADLVVMGDTLTRSPFRFPDNIMELFRGHATHSIGR